MRAAQVWLAGALLLAVFGCAGTTAPSSPEAAPPASPEEAAPGSVAELEAEAAIEPGADETAPFEAAPAGSQLVFWELHHPERPGRMHLLGSVHRLDASRHQLDPAIERAWRDAEVLVVEMDLTAMDPADKQLVVEETGRLPSGTTLESRLQPSTWSLLESTMESYGSSASRINVFKPWFVALLVAETEMARSGYDPSLGIDRQFLDRAHGQRPIEALETLDQQIRAFDDLPNSLQELMLREALFLAGSQQLRVNRVMNAWRGGDLEELEIALFADLEDHPELHPFYDRIYRGRNLTWAQQIDGLFDGRHLFVVVGAGHMVGDVNLIGLLRGRGFEVRRVPASR